MEKLQWPKKTREYRIDEAEPILLQKITDILNDRKNPKIIIMNTLTGMSFHYRIFPDIPFDSDADTKYMGITLIYSDYCDIVEVY